MLKQGVRRRVLRPLCLLAGLVWAGALLAVPATQPSPSANPAEVDPLQTLYEVLQDPAARDALLARLEAAMGTGDSSPAGEEDSAEDLLRLPSLPNGQSLIGEVADGVSALWQQMDQLAAVVGQMKAGAAQLDQALAAPAGRSAVLHAIVGIVALLALTGAIWVGLWLVAKRLRPEPTEPLPDGFFGRAVLGAWLLFLDAAPVLAATGSGYLLIGLWHPSDVERELAGALIGVMAAVGLGRAVALALWAPRVTEMRFWEMGDETAHYLVIWSMRLVVAVAVAYFGGHLAVGLELAPDAAAGLVKLLVLLPLGLSLVFIAQNRQEVAALLAPMGASRARQRVAASWHWLMGAMALLVYVLWVLDVRGAGSFLAAAALKTAVVLLVLQLALRAVQLVFRRSLKLQRELDERFPALELRLNRYIPALERAVAVVLWFLSALVLLQVWGLDGLAWVASDWGQRLLGLAARLGLILAIAWCVWVVASGFIRAYLQRQVSTEGPGSSGARMKTLLSVARNALLVVLVLITSLMLLSELGVDTGPLLAGAGVLGLAIGFGAQRLVQDVINGAFILVQNLMSVGDVVSLSGTAGVVESLNIRSVQLRDLGGVVHTIPFSSIDTVSNLTKDFSNYVFDLGVAYREDVDQVMEVIEEVGAELQQSEDIGPLMLEPVEIFGVDAFGDSAVVIKGRFKTQPIKQWAVGRAFNRRIKQRFDELGIEIPFPHRTLYFGIGKEGEAPPARILTESLVAKDTEAVEAESADAA